MSEVFHPSEVQFGIRQQYKVFLRTKNILEM